MNSSPPTVSSGIYCQSLPHWLRRSSITTLMASVGLLCFSLYAYNNSQIFAATLIPSLLVAMSFAIFLNIYTLWLLKKEQRSADRAFRNTDCEFSSIFQNVLDGILIIDNAGDCLDANPAAAGILRCSVNELIGRNIDHFMLDRGSFASKWTSFLERKTQRGRAHLTADDGTTLYVDFTSATNYLPGRHVFIICDVTERTYAESSLRNSEERFRLMANNIQEIFWMMDADTQAITYINPAYTAITGHAVESLHEDPSAYRELIHPDDRIRVLSKLKELTHSRVLDEEFRFVRADGEVRWGWAKGVPVPADGETRWIVGTAQDITSRKQAEMKIVEQLDAVEAARAEAEALRKSTLALSQNLAMDSVLDTLLNCISELVPFDKAAVLFVEDGTELLVAREAPQLPPEHVGLTFNATENVFFQRIIFEKKTVFLPDVAEQADWSHPSPLGQLRSWLGIPLVAGGQVLGILSLGARSPRVFTMEHHRLAKSLAVPAAVAIRNARTHERAEIYAAELESRLIELDDAQKVLRTIGRSTPSH